MAKRKAKAQSLDHSIVQGTLYQVWDEYVDQFSFKKVPISITFLDYLAVELVTWLRDNERAIKINDFLNMKGIHRSTFDYWRKRSDKLDQAYRFALQILGCRRESYGFFKQASEKITILTQPRYDEEWISDLMFAAKIQQQQQDNETYLVKRILTEEEK